jgi:hypothetical protein
MEVFKSFEQYDRCPADCSSELVSAGDIFIRIASEHQ